MAEYLGAADIAEEFSDKCVAFCNAVGGSNQLQFDELEGVLKWIPTICGPAVVVPPPGREATTNLDGEATHMMALGIVNKLLEVSSSTTATPAHLSAGSTTQQDNKSRFFSLLVEFYCRLWLFLSTATIVVDGGSSPSPPQNGDDVPVPSTVVAGGDADEEAPLVFSSGPHKRPRSPNDPTLTTQQPRQGGGAEGGGNGRGGVNNIPTALLDLHQQDEETLFQVFFPRLMMAQSAMEAGLLPQAPKGNSSTVVITTDGSSSSSSIEKAAPRPAPVNLENILTSLLVTPHPTSGRIRKRQRLAIRELHTVGRLFPSDIAFPPGGRMGAPTKATQPTKPGGGRGSQPRRSSNSRSTPTSAISIPSNNNDVSSTGHLLDRLSQSGGGAGSNSMGGIDNVLTRTSSGGPSPRSVGVGTGGGGPPLMRQTSAHAKSVLSRLQLDASIFLEEDDDASLAPSPATGTSPTLTHAPGPFMVPLMSAGLLGGGGSQRGSNTCSPTSMNGSTGVAVAFPSAPISVVANPFTHPMPATTQGTGSESTGMSNGQNSRSSAGENGSGQTSPITQTVGGENSNSSGIQQQPPDAGGGTQGGTRSVINNPTPGVVKLAGGLVLRAHPQSSQQSQQQQKPPVHQRTGGREKGVPAYMLTKRKHSPPAVATVAHPSGHRDHHHQHPPVASSTRTQQLFSKPTHHRTKSAWSQMGIEEDAHDDEVDDHSAEDVLATFRQASTHDGLMGGGAGGGAAGVAGAKLGSVVEEDDAVGIPQPTTRGDKHIRGGVSSSLMSLPLVMTTPPPPMRVKSEPALQFNTSDLNNNNTDDRGGVQGFSEFDVVPPTP